jgi:hypothetical protein
MLLLYNRNNTFIKRIKQKNQKKPRKNGYHREIEMKLNS